MELGLFLYVSKINQIEFAKKVGISRNYLNQIINKRLRPSTTVAKVIEMETRGVVSAKDILNIYPTKGKEKLELNSKDKE